MVWSLGFYGGAINYLHVAHCGESWAAGSAVFDQCLFTGDDYMICITRMQTENTKYSRLQYPVTGTCKE